MITVFQNFTRKKMYLITYEALTSKPLMICNFCFGYLLIRYYRSLMLNIDEIRDVRVKNLEILFTFLCFSPYIYNLALFKKKLRLFFSQKLFYNSRTILYMNYSTKKVNKISRFVTLTSRISSIFSISD